MSDAITVGRRTIPISHADRVMFPEVGLTKLDLARHYADVAEVMVPHVRGRPLALQSFPQGIAGQRLLPQGRPAALPGLDRDGAEVPKREGGAIRHVLADDAATLVYLAGQNVITPARLDQPRRPPGAAGPADLRPRSLDAAVRRGARGGARAWAACCARSAWRPFAMTTGSRGLHVVVPLRRTADFAAVHGFAREVAVALVERDPDGLTVEFRREKRGERIFVDVNRTAYGQHAVAPYAVRPLPTAPVATPLRWEELDDPALDPRGWTVATIGARLAAGGDPWRDIARHARSIGPARRALGG